MQTAPSVNTISNSSGVNCVTGLASGCAAANITPVSSSPSELELSEDQRSRDNHWFKSKLWDNNII